MPFRDLRIPRRPCAERDHFQDRFSMPRLRGQRVSDREGFGFDACEEDCDGTGPCGRGGHRGARGAHRPGRDARLHAGDRSMRKCSSRLGRAEDGGAGPGPALHERAPSPIARSPAGRTPPGGRPADSGTLAYFRAASRIFPGDVSPRAGPDRSPSPAHRTNPCDDPKPSAASEATGGRFKSCK